MISFADTAVSVSPSPMVKPSGQSMTKYPGSRMTLRVKSSADVGARICNFLRSRYPRKTADEVSADTGIAMTTIASWLERSAVPGGVAILTLIDCYGAEFLAAALPRQAGWLSRAACDAQRERLEADIASLRSELERIGA